MGVSRRRVIGWGAGIGLAAAAAVIGMTDGDRIIDRLDPPDGSVPSAGGTTIVRGALASKARGRMVHWQLAYPPRTKTDATLPVVMVLHGKGDDAADAFGSQHLDRFLAAAVDSGSPPFVLAAIDGGADTYWHKRADGDDPQAMLLDEFLPLLHARGLRTDVFGLTGWSMGGYGCLLLAETVPTRVKVVATDAAAVWLKGADTAAGAFDDLEDFQAHDVMAHLDQLHGIPVRIGCGRSDTFAATNHLLAREIPASESDFPRGAHDAATWDQLRLEDMRFLGRHLL